MEKKELQILNIMKEMKCSWEEAVERSKERIPLPGFTLLFKERSLEGIIQILNRANTYQENHKRHSYFSGLSKNQWCDVLDRKVRESKFLDSDL